MLRRFDESIQTLSSIISMKAERLCDRLGTKIVDEDDFTSRLIQSIEEAVDGLVIDGIQWSIDTRKLPWRGKDSEESRYGADFGVVIRMEGNGIDVSKGYLIQAKREIAGFPTHPADLFAHKIDRRLPVQARKMLEVTPESYVWFYTQNGVHIIRAGTLLGASGSPLGELRFQGIHGFFVRAFMSWSGDYRLGEMAAKNLDIFMQDYDLRRAIFISGRKVREREFE
ncbi:MAG: hypothetical protein ACT6QU_10910 [Aliihoeflea sp.]|uniref:hypothetical protein n=1 Tax=Aliihoeflea sp. TaxID=2608088 RepID=UPI004037A755